MHAGLISASNMINKSFFMLIIYEFKPICKPIGPKNIKKFLEAITILILFNTTAYNSLYQLQGKQHESYKKVP